MGRNERMKEDEDVIGVSFAKALILSAAQMVLFMALVCWMAASHLRDPLLTGFLVGMFLVATPAFALAMCLMFRCRISSEGLCPGVPALFKVTLRWEEIASVRSKRMMLIPGVCYVVRGNLFFMFPVAGPFLAKDPERLKQLVRQYAPAGNIFRAEVER